MIEGIDYIFVYSEDKTETVRIKILSGEYADVVYKYGGVKFEEKNDECHLLFNYTVLESPKIKPKQLENNENFKTFIGNLLVEFLSSNLKMEDTDETGNNDTEKFDI
jgi:hypothetical protein